MRILASLMLAAALFAGCAGGDDGTPQTTSVTPPPGGFLAGPPLWNDPQNTPHAAFGWPTLSSPPTVLPNHWWAPIPPNMLPAAGVTGMDPLAQATDVAQGAGIAIFGSIAYVPGFGESSYIVDLSDPAHPALINQSAPPHSERGAAFVAYPDGRLAVAVSEGDGFTVWDLTDPTTPILANETALNIPGTSGQGGHKLGVVPGTPILYNAGSNGGGQLGAIPSMANGVTEIFDLTDPYHPVHVQDFANGYSCHHVYFWNAPDGSKQRAICAGIQATQIWDTSNPREPTVIVTVPFFHGNPALPATVPPFSIAHYAGLSLDGNVLLVGDEWGGGGNPPPGCTVSVETPQGVVSVPLGAVWFYDVATETSPQLLGWYAPMIDLSDQHVALDPTNPISGPSCTAHHGRLVPDPAGRDMLAMSFYGDGVVLIDFTAIRATPPGLPRVVDQFSPGDNDTWETWYDQGYLITGDLGRGLDVLKLV